MLPQQGLIFTADDGHSGGLVGGCLVLPPGRALWQPEHAKCSKLPTSPTACDKGASLIRSGITG